MGNPSAEYLRVVALLGFDDWTPAEKVIEALTFTIKPLRAIERYERTSASSEKVRRERRAKAIANGTFDPKKSHVRPPIESRDGKIRSGARDILNDAIANTRAAGLVEMKVVEGERLLRRKERRQRDATRFLVCCHHGLPCPESATRPSEEEVLPLD